MRERLIKITECLASWDMVILPFKAEHVKLENNLTDRPPDRETWKWMILFFAVDRYQTIIFDERNKLGKFILISTLVEVVVEVEVELGNYVLGRITKLCYPTRISFSCVCRSVLSQSWKIHRHCQNVHAISTLNCFFYYSMHFIWLSNRQIKYKDQK